MDLTEQQVRAVREWAARAGHVVVVCLFGRGAKYCAKPESDVDLAITVGVGHYVALADKWEADLSKSLGLQVKLNQYNCRASHTVRDYCDEFSLILFTASHSPQTD